MPRATAGAPAVVVVVVVLGGEVVLVATETVERLGAFTGFELVVDRLGVVVDVVAAFGYVVAVAFGAVVVVGSGRTGVVEGEAPPCDETDFPTECEADALLVPRLTCRTPTEGARLASGDELLRRCRRGTTTTSAATNRAPAAMLDAQAITTRRFERSPVGSTALRVLRLLPVFSASTAVRTACQTFSQAAESGSGGPE